jgi:hypothetical protein
MSAGQLTVSVRAAEPLTALRRLLALDAALTGANALAYLALPGPLGRLLGLDSWLLLLAGADLAVFAVAVGTLAARNVPRAVPAVATANLAWAALSCLALGLWLTPSAVGVVWIVLQAVVVAVLGVLQHAVLRAAGQRNRS